LIKIKWLILFAFMLKRLIFCKGMNGKVV